MKTISDNTNPNLPQSQVVSFSKHSRKRAQQRCITENLICLALDYSTTVFKQGLIFYAVMEKLLPDAMDHKLRERLNNIVVVVSQDSNEILTCYKRQNAIHYINKKSKYLLM